MARAKEICPPGIWCLSPLTGFFGILSMVLLIGFLAYILQTKPIQAPLPPREERSGNERGERSGNERGGSRQPIRITNIAEGGDDRYTRAPEPQRFWNNGPEVPYPPRGALVPPDGGILINVPTQGYPEAYQQMGILKDNQGKILPLYGRRVASRADRFNYYTRTDTYNPVQLPLRYKRKDCQDPVGCDELFDGDDITITPTGEKAKATLYRFDGPMYVPSII